MTTATGAVAFSGKLSAGAHNFGGSSLALGGQPALGKLQISKPAAKAGSPNLFVDKIGPSGAGPGDAITYTLNYGNTASGVANTATGVQLIDTIPAGLAFNASSCSPACTVLSPTEIRWTFASLAPGATGSATFQATVPSGAAFGTTYTNSVQVVSAENDANTTDNSDSVTTTVSFNRSPVANNDTLATNEGTAGSVNVLTNDSDPDANTLTVTTLSPSATHGTVSCTAVGVCTYTPAANFFGTDSFTYTISDGNGGTATATVNVTVTNVNDDPVAVNDTATVAEDSSSNAIDVLANDTDGVDAGETLTVTAVTQPTNGSAAFTATGVTYTPAANFFGADSFTYTISDGNGGTATATVNVTVTNVNDDPVAVNDTATVAEDSSSNAIDVLANDTDGVDAGETLTVTAVTQPTNGSAAFTATGVSYTPAANFFGADSFTYTISDGNGGTATATVNVTVTNVNDDPVAVNDTATVAEDSSSNAIDVLANDTDGVDAGETLTVTAVTQPTNGSAAFTATGVTYTPAANFFGADSFTYTISDGNGGTATATVNVTVTNVNDDPVAVNDTATVAEDSSSNAIDVLANDTDGVDAGETLTVTAVTQPTNGSAAFTATGVTYTPAANFFGADSFTYTISDGNGGTATATVNVTVTNVNDDPVAVNDTATVAEDSSSNAIDVLANDTDGVDAGETLTVTAVTQPTNGSAAFTATGVSYTPAANFFGADSFTYTISDGNGGTATATVNVTVTNVNDDPVAVNDTATVAEDSSSNAIDVLANDTDGVDAGETLTVTAVTQPTNGSAAFTATGVSLHPGRQLLRRRLLHLHHLRRQRGHGHGHRQRHGDQRQRRPGGRQRHRHRGRGLELQRHRRAGQRHRRRGRRRDPDRHRRDPAHQRLRCLHRHRRDLHPGRQLLRRRLLHLHHLRRQRRHGHGHRQRHGDQRQRRPGGRQRHRHRGRGLELQRHRRPGQRHRRRRRRRDPDRHRRDPAAPTARPPSPPPA